MCVISLLYLFKITNRFPQFGELPGAAVHLDALVDQYVTNQFHERNRPPEKKLARRKRAYATAKNLVRSFSRSVCSASYFIS